MQLHHLPALDRRKSQRVGRGGKRGTTSGRGQKGQKSRSGRKMRPAVRDLVLRIAKRRGFRNKPHDNKPLALNLARLAPKLKTLAAASKTVKLDIVTLKEISAVPARYQGEIKLVGRAELAIALNVKGLKVSAGAKESIEKAKGKVE